MLWAYPKIFWLHVAKDSGNRNDMTLGVVCWRDFGGKHDSMTDAGDTLCQLENTFPHITTYETIRIARPCHLIQFSKSWFVFFLSWPSSSIQYSICANLRWDLELYVETLVAKASPTRTRIKYLSMSFRWRIVANEGMREANKSLTLVAHANRNYRATTGLHGCQPCLCTGNNAKKKQVDFAKPFNIQHEWLQRGSQPMNLAAGPQVWSGSYYTRM